MFPVSSEIDLILDEGNKSTKPFRFAAMASLEKKAVHVPRDSKSTLRKIRRRLNKHDLIDEICNEIVWGAALYISYLSTWLEIVISKSHLQNRILMNSFVEICSIVVLYRTLSDDGFSIGNSNIPRNEMQIFGLLDFKHIL